MPNKENMENTHTMQKKIQCSLNATIKNAENTKNAKNTKEIFNKCITILKLQKLNK